MKYGIVRFPGSNCDHDAFTAASQSGSAVYLWHKDTQIPKGIDCIILPGGFSYGDYLRCGAIARFSPIMKEVVTFARNGGLVIGICNGFQILTEAGLLPGVLLQNSGLNFVCRDVFLSVANASTPFTSSYTQNQIIRIPVAHGDGNYYADADTISKLETNNQVVFRYCNADGQLTGEANPNGSINNIAGIINKGGNVLGMMPHPERYADSLLGCADGRGVFQSLELFGLSNSTKTVESISY
ncbi:MAG: phosphoribosylformylglycinamidine synthase subunit PurQ [Ignavibacteriae bacterium]|nr:phosphoribosylformylglycinamidine synthase subunit PurQ [Ignavibacteriota bacterium]